MLPRSFTLYKILVHNTTRTVNMSCSEQLYVCQIGLGLGYSKRPLSYGKKGNLAFCWSAPNIWPAFAVGLSVNRHTCTKKPYDENGNSSNNGSVDSKTETHSATLKLPNDELNELRLNMTHSGDSNKPPEATSNKFAPNPQVQGKFEDGKSPETKIVKITPCATPKKYQRVDLSAHSLERNFITPVRAMSDFLLKPTDLEGLRKTKRRSPYESEPPITVFWRKDVEAKAMEVWGSREQLLKELLFRDAERRRYQQNIFSVKRRLKEFRRVEARSIPGKFNYEAGLFGSSGRVVLTAIVINMSNFIFKVFAWFYTGSHSMFSECVHSLADTINQLILAYGIHKSVQQADSEHPYGYANMKYVASLISGVGIFCVGTGLSIYHGITGLLHPEPLQSFYWAFYILGGSLVSEGATLLVAVNSIRKGAKKK